MGYFLTRQRDFNDNCLYIEISSMGPKKAGVDILTTRYPGEGKNLVSPKDAVDVAERIYKQWEKEYWDEKKQLRILIDEKTTRIFEFDAKGIAAAKTWADKTLATMTKCKHCSRPIGKNKAIYEIDALPNAVFCDEVCLSTKYRDMFGTEPLKINAKGKKVRI
jgi:hypothetical protein